MNHTLFSNAVTQLADGALECRELVGVIDDHVVIVLRKKNAIFAFEHAPFNDDGDGPVYRVTDEETFIKELVSALLEEEEDGSTCVTDMLDKTFRHMVDQGAEGFCSADELKRIEEFERENTEEDRQIDLFDAEGGL